MLFYVGRSSLFDDKVCPCKNIKLTKVYFDQYKFWTYWILEADNLDDALNILMSESPYGQFSLFKRGYEEDKIGDDIVEWYIEIDDDTLNYDDDDD